MCVFNSCPYIRLRPPTESSDGFTGFFFGPELALCAPSKSIPSFIPQSASSALSVLSAWEALEVLMAF